MKTFLNLVKINLKNSMYSTMGNKKRNAYSMIMIWGMIIVYLAGIMIFSAYTQAHVLLAANLPMSSLLLQGALPVLLIVFIGAFFGMQQYLFKAKDYEMIASLPIPTYVVCLSRITAQMLIYFGYSLIFFLPYAITYCIYSTITIGTVLMIVLTILCIPLFATSVAMILSLCIQSIGRNSTIVQYIRVSIMAIVIGLLVYLYMTMSQSSSSAISTTLFYTQWIVDSITHPLSLATLWFVLSSVFPFVFLLYMVSHFYTYLYGYFNRTTKKKNKVPDSVCSKSPFQALLKKEWLRLSTSISYLTNSCMGLLLLLLSPIFVYFTFPKGAMDTTMLSIILVGIITYALALNSPLVISISLEGNAFWIAKSIPLSPTYILLAKTVLQLVLFLPIGLVATLCLTLVAYLPWYLVCILLLYTVAMVFVITTFALYCAKKYYNLSYTSEIQVIKQSKAVFFHVLFGMILSLVHILLLIWLSKYLAIWILLLGISLLWLVVSIPLLIHQVKITPQQLNNML